MNILVSNVQNHIAELFKKEDTSKLFFHNYAHTVEVVNTVQKMAVEEALNPKDKEILVLAAWFHDLGYLYSYHEHEAKSITLAKAYLASINYPEEDLIKLVGCIAATKLSETPNTHLESLLKDADLSYGVTSHFFERGALLRLEWKEQLNKTYTELIWEKLQLNFLSTIEFYSSYAELHFKPIVQDNLVKQKDIFTKIKKSLKL